MYVESREDIIEEKDLSGRVYCTSERYPSLLATSETLGKSTYPRAASNEPTIV
jgi:hypothetical protein